MKKTAIITLALIMLMLSVAGCSRSASKAPDVTPEFMEQVGTLLPVDQQIYNATMTAQAIIEEFNMPTQIVQNAQGTPVAITQMPPSLSSFFTTYSTRSLLVTVMPSGA